MTPVWPSYGVTRRTRARRAGWSAARLAGATQRFAVTIGVFVAGASFTDQVVTVLRRLPPGQVMTYGEVAAEAGRPGAARAVGNALRDASGVPWWRVVATTGRVNPHDVTEASRRLRAEGVCVRQGRVVRSL